MSYDTRSKSEECSTAAKMIPNKIPNASTKKENIEQWLGYRSIRRSAHQGLVHDDEIQIVFVPPSFPHVYSNYVGNDEDMKGHLVEQ